MSDTDELAAEEQFSRSLDEPTSDDNRPGRLRLVEVLKNREANDPATRLFLRLLQDSDWLVQHVTIEALKARLDIARHLLPDLISLLPRRENRVRWRVCEVLAELGRDASAALPTLQEMEPDSAIARAIWRISGQKERVIRLLVRLMDDPSREGEEVCDLIYELGPDASATVPALVRALRVNEADLRWAAVDALGAIGPKAAEAVPALVGLLNSPSGLVAGRAAIALALIGPASVPALIGALQNSDSRTREFAADALSQIGAAAQSAAPYLKNLLDDPNRDVAEWSTIALAKTTKDESAVPLLIQIINQTANEYLRQQATVALDEIVTAHKWKDQRAQ
jgi:HEAT repeat protein